jgi:hypothetical protein
MIVGPLPPSSSSSGFAPAWGNNADPPASVPPYLAVVVTSSVSKPGPVITGDTVGIVVVETRPGYAQSPGHAGTGTVIARVC